MAHFGQHYPGRAAALTETLEVTGSRSIVSLEEAAATYPQYARLRDLIHSRQIDVAVCRETSRLGRTAPLVLQIEAAAKEHGVRVVPRYGARPELDGDNDGYALVSAIQSTISQQEVAQLMRRKEMGFKARIEKSHLFASQAPYGYRNVRSPHTGKVTHVEVVPEQAAVVRLIFLDLYLERGLGEPAIAAELNRRDIPTPSAHKAEAGDKHAPATSWQVASVHQLLNRLECYAGYAYWRRKSGQPYIADGGHKKHPKRAALVSAKGNHPAILSEAEVEAVLAEKSSRSFKRRTRLWSGSAVCAVCQGLMMGTGVTYVKGGQKALVDAMLCRMCGQTITDAAIMDAVRAKVGSLQAQADDDALAAGMEAAQHNAAAEVAAIKARLADLDAERSRLVSALAKGRISDDGFDEAASAVAKARAAEVAALEKAQGVQAQEVDASRRAERLEEVRQSAAEILDAAEEAPDFVRGWLRRHVRAYVSPRKSGGRGAKRVKVAFI